MTVDDLLAEVLANPDDDAPRLVLADWLMERGDPRGEFIRIQCELSARTDMLPQERESLQKREIELLQEHRAGWCQQLGLHEDTVGFERGMPSRVLLSWQEFMATRGRLERIPLQELGLLGADNVDLPSVLSWVGTRKLKTLRMRGCTIEDEDATMIANAECLSRLIDLDLSENQIGHKGIRSIANTRFLSSVKYLNLASNLLGTEGAVVLSESNGVKGLEFLSLRFNGIGYNGVVAIARSNSMPRLEKIDLSHNSILDEGAMSLAKSKMLLHLTDIGLRRGGIGAIGAKALAGSWRIKNLAHLDLSLNSIESEGAGALAAARFSAIKHLNLSCTRIGDEGVRALAKSKSLSSLTSLDLSNNPIGPAGIKALASSTCLINLREIDLFGIVPGGDMTDIRSRFSEGLIVLD